MNKSIVAILVALICIGHAMKPAEGAKLKPKPKPKQKQKQELAVARRGSASKKVEVKLGIAMMYNWWQPAFMKLENGLTGTVKAKNHSTVYGGSFMMGPTLWLKIGSSWNIGMTALFGLTKNEFTYSTLAVDANLLYLIIPDNFFSMYLEKGKSESRRYEADFAVEHPFHKFFNLLFGARFNYFDGNGDSTRFSNLNFPISITNEKYKAWYLGPSLGVGFYYEIKGFSINIGVSALFQGGVYYCKKYLINPTLSFFAFIPDEFAMGYLAIGGEANLKLAYFVERIRVEFWVGGRYTILPHISLNDAGSAYNIAYKKGWITGELEQFCGITFGAAYKF